MAVPRRLQRSGATGGPAMKPAAAMLAGLLLAGPVPQSSRFSTSVDAVLVDALVMSNRRPVSGLVATDFQVFCDSALRPHTLVDTGPLPIDLEFLVDRSDSMADRDFPALASTVRQLAGTVRPVDSAHLTTFTHVLLGRWGLDDSDPGRRNLMAPVRAGGTALRDAVFATAVRARRGVRTLLLVMSDGEDTASWLSEQTVMEAVEHSDVVVYAIALPLRDANPWKPEPVSSFLTRVTSATGGRWMPLSTRVGEQVAEIMNEHANRYVLAFEPAAGTQPGWHRIEVKTRRGNVIARRGYFARK